MISPLFQERRFSKRKRLTGLLPGRITLGSGDTNVDLRPVDISANGMGVLSPILMKTGTVLTLSAPQQTIELRITWSQPDFGKQDLYRYGLVTADEDVNLEEVFLENGCLE